MAQLTLGGGCFWCTEAVFKRLEGVQDVVPGYAGGHTEDPTYEEVCSGDTGHAEVIQVTYDPGTVPTRTLLHVFFSVHDPTTEDREGADVGSQYRSIVLWHDDEQRALTEEVVEELETTLFDDPIVTDVEPLDEFYVAEDKHHDYYEANQETGYCRVVIDPKLNKLRSQWKDKVKTEA